MNLELHGSLVKNSSRRVGKKYLWMADYDYQMLRLAMPLLHNKEAGLCLGKLLRTFAFYPKIASED